jgi:hypothetical protein
MIPEAADMNEEKEYNKSMAFAIKRNDELIFECRQLPACQLRTLQGSLGCNCAPPTTPDDSSNVLFHEKPTLPTDIVTD